MQRDGGPGGPGAGGNPTGGSFTGPAEALEIIGDHAYAVSGTFASTTATQTLLNFTSGNYYFVGTLTCSGGVEFTSAGVGSGTLNAWQLSFNGSAIAIFLTDTLDRDKPTNSVVPIIIAPYTEVQLEMLANDNNTEDLASAGLHGRIYRG